MLPMKGITLLFNFILCIISAECAKILAVCNYPTKSHYILCSKLMIGMAAKGHEVTVVSHFSQVVPINNYREIILGENGKKVPAPAGKALIRTSRSNFIKQFTRPPKYAMEVISHTWEDPNFKTLLDSDEKFDLIILQLFLNEALFGLALRFGCPLILLHTFSPTIWTNHLVGNIAPYSYSPTLYTTYSPKMSFYERLVNTLYGLTFEAYHRFIHLRRQDVILKQYFKGAPDLEEVMYNNVSMIFFNNHLSVSGAKPLVPAMINIGGFHINDEEPLPTELQNFMDNAKHGVIYFSLGSKIVTDDLPAATITAIFKTFSKLKQNVLCKCASLNHIDTPDNVKIMKWLPQNAILAHPNLKVFVSHGGILSVIEAVHYGVPIIGFPLFADQHINVQTAVEKGFGLKLDIFYITEEIFTETLRKIIEEPRYKNAANVHSRILRDQPVKPLDTAVFWAEHVISHKGARHLRTQAMELHWIQIYLLDIIFFLLLISVFLFISLYKLFTKCFSVKIRMKKKKNN